MRLHVVALPHTQVTRAYDWCAYTAKIRRLGAMLEMYGHNMVLYSYGDNEAVCAEHVSLGPAEPWDHDVVFNDWEPDSPRWHDMNAAAVKEIRERIGPRDAVGIIAGRCQAQIADAFPNHLALEWGIGYAGVLPNSLRAFESHAWRHYVHGYSHDSHGRFFDTVIPNAFDVDDFTTGADVGYLLFVGRPDPTKGIGIVAELAERFEVITAGQGGERIPGVEHRGIVRGAEKAELFAHATAVLVPTIYLEPFGGVCVEAMMSGVPAITTDFGAFPELVEHGIDGYRCSTLHDFVTAVYAAPGLDRSEIAARARARFSTAAVAPQYDRWLRRCETLYDEGWYQVAI